MELTLTGSIQSKYIFLKSCKVNFVTFSFIYRPADQQIFVDLLALLKQRLNAKGKLLAIAAGAGTWRVSQSYKIPDVCRNVDIMNLMSYDMQWPYTETGRLKKNFKLFWFEILD